jgi:hypothetical protein
MHFINHSNWLGVLKDLVLQPISSLRIAAGQACEKRLIAPGSPGGELLGALPVPVEN